MAGFKQTILSHEPKLFLTFDGDNFDPVARTLMAVPPRFMDESGFDSTVILHNEDASYPAYRMGLPSLVDIEQTDQHCISFGWYGHQPQAMTRWPKAFVEVTHQSHLAFTERLGSFTVGFYVRKESNEEKFREIERLAGNSYTMTLNKRWIRKAGSFDFYHRDPWASAESIVVGHPAGEFTMTVPSWFYKNKHFVVLTWEVTEIENDTYRSEAKLFINGHLFDSYSNVTSGSYPNSLSTTPIEVAGVINAAASFEDRQTSDLQLDQIFVLDKALSHDEICRLYRKSKTYDNINIEGRAVSYWPFSEAESTTDTTIKDMVGYADGVYLGGITRVNRNQAPPPQIQGSRSVYFHNGGMAAVHQKTSSSYQPVFNFEADWSVHMWVQFSNSERSVIFACQEDDFPHEGILIEANRRNHTNVPGHFQLSVDSDFIVSTRQNQDNGQPFNFNDGRFHHIAAVRKGDEVSLWVDGIKHGTVFCPVKSVTLPGPGQVYIMGASPGHLNTTGYLSSVGVFNYALDDAEIRMFNIYNYIYRIQGTVTLQGNPHRATIRAYYHRTGELAWETESDSDNGNYKMTLYDNSLIDLVVLNRQDPNIRYRVYGPIKPAEYYDTY